MFKARRGIEDVYELTYIRKDGSRLPAVVSVTALQDAADAIIGYLLIGTDNTARQQVEAERRRLDAVLQGQSPGAAEGQGGGRGSEPGEVGLPLQHEPRAALAAERRSSASRN